MVGLSNSTSVLVAYLLNVRPEAPGTCLALLERIAMLFVRVCRRDLKELCTWDSCLVLLLKRSNVVCVVVLKLTTFGIPLALDSKLHLRFFLNSKGEKGVFVSSHRYLTFPGLRNPRVDMEVQLILTLRKLMGTPLVYRITLKRMGILRPLVEEYKIVVLRNVFALPPV